MHTYLPISLAVCIVVQSAIALVLVPAPVGFGLLLSDIYEHSHSLDLSFWALKHMNLQLLHGQDTQLAAELLAISCLGALRPAGPGLRVPRGI